MMNSSSRSRIRARIMTILVLIVATAAHLALAGNPVSSLSDGPPVIQGQKLGTQSYVEVKAKRLANAKVVWVNFDYLRELGVEIPANGLTPEFEKQILDAFAYAVPGAKDQISDFLPIEKTLHADRYGGEGLGANWGSGRAASSGQVQIKGVGVTALVGVGQTYDHAHGRASFEESVREAIWGEVANRDLPHGANRVIAILDTGTYTHWADGGTERNALIVRGDPSRPAHYMTTPSGWSDTLRATDPARAREATTFIDRALPIPPGAEKLPTGEKITAGFQEYVDRLADQYAAMYANKYYHGATSQSNMEISGRFIDYGTMTAQPGYGKVQILAHVAPAGDTDEIQRILIRDFIGNFKSAAPGDIAKAVPDSGALTKRFSQRYEEALTRNFLELTGAPARLIEKLQTTPESRELGNQLIAVAQHGAKLVNVDETMPDRTSSYDLQKVLTRLAGANITDPAALENAIAGDIEDVKIRANLAKAYNAYMNKVIALAHQEGVSPRHLLTYISENCRIRNADTPELFRPSLVDQDNALIEEYMQNGDRGKIWEFINSRIASSQRKVDSGRPYELVLRDTHDPVNQTHSRYIYDAKSGEYAIEIVEPVREGKTEFFGNRLEVSQVKGARLQYTTDGWKTTHETSPNLTEGSMSFRLPVQARDIQAEVALRSDDGKTWWKAGKQNVSLRFNAGEAPKIAGSGCIGMIAEQLLHGGP